MRRKCSFLLTILPPEDRLASLQGRLEVISTGQISRFTSLDELRSLLEMEIEQQISPVPHPLPLPDESKK